MSPFGIVAFVAGVFALVFFLWKVIAKENAWKHVHFLIGGLFLVFFVCFILWAKDLYKNDDPNLGMWTFAVIGLFYGSILAYPYTKPYRVLTYVNMTLFLLLGVAVVILAVCLSKSVLQPNATYLALPLI